MKRRQRREIQAVRRLASSYSQGVPGIDNSETLYTLVDGLTGEVAGGVRLDLLPDLSTCCDLSRL